MSPMSSSLTDLRARLAALPPDALRAILENAVSPAPDDVPAPDGSRIIRVAGADGRTLSFRLSADDLRL